MVLVFGGLLVYVLTIGYLGLLIWDNRDLLQKNKMLKGQHSQVAIENICLRDTIEGLKKTILHERLVHACEAAGWQRTAGPSLDGSSSPLPALERKPLVNFPSYPSEFVHTKPVLPSTNRFKLGRIVAFPVPE